MWIKLFSWLVTIITLLEIPINQTSKMIPNSSHYYPDSKSIKNAVLRHLSQACGAFWQFLHLGFAAWPYWKLQYGSSLQRDPGWSNGPWWFTSGGVRGVHGEKKSSREGLGCDRGFWPRKTGGFFPENCFFLMFFSIKTTFEDRFVYPTPLDGRLAQRWLSLAFQRRPQHRRSGFC